MKILALDLGKFNTMCCFFDSKSRNHTFLNASTDRDYLSTLFKKYKCDLVVMEACGPSGWINDLAQSQLWGHPSYFKRVAGTPESIANETHKRGQVCFHTSGSPLAAVT